MGLTLKEYAALHGISYEAVRGSFTTHKDKELLEGTHYELSGRQRILTEAGVSVMDTFRPQSRNKPLAIHPDNIEALKAQLADLESKRTALEDRVHDLNTENADLRLRITELESQLADHKDRLIQTLFLLQETQGRLLTATEDAKKPGFFARLFGKK